MIAPDWLPLFVEATFFLCVGYSLLLFLFVLGMLVFSTAESRYRAKKKTFEDYDALAGSPYAIPVSIIAPAHNEEVMVLPAVRSLLQQHYPEFEVILVDDASTDETLPLLKREYDLQAQESFHRNIVPSDPSGALVYRSRTEPRLVVVSKSKSGGNKADAMNAGINVARYRYFCFVDGDTVYVPDALMNAMTEVAKDPAHIVGATSLFGNSREPETQNASADGRRIVDRHLLSNFQHLDLMRSFIGYRLAWSRLGFMLCNPGAFAIWRRDVIAEVGGFSKAFSCEDIEMTFRVHEKLRREKRPYRILALPDLVAHTEGPDSVSSLVRQRARWQKVTLETVWHYRRMLLRPSYGSVGMVGAPYFVLFEALAPLIQALSFVSLSFAIWFDLLDWTSYLALLGIVVFAGAIPTTATLWMHDAAYRDYRFKDLLRMLAIGPLDLFLYRPIVMYAGLRGTWQFLRNDRGWDKFERNVRQAKPG